MGDLVKRLRDAAASPAGLYAEAANEIEKLCESLRNDVDAWTDARGRAIEKDDTWLLMFCDQQIRAANKVLAKYNTPKATA